MFWLESLIRPFIALLFLLVVPVQPANANDQQQQLEALYADRSIGQIYGPQILKRFVRFEMSNAWWEKMNSKDRTGTRALAYVVGGIKDFGKAMNWGDVVKIEDSSGGTKAEKRERINSMLNNWENKVTVTLKVEPKNCDSKSFDLAMRYFTALGQVLDSGDFKPASGIANITLLISSGAKDISVSTKDGKNFVLIGPVGNEPDDWGSKIDDGFESLSKKM